MLFQPDSVERIDFVPGYHTEADFNQQGQPIIDEVMDLSPRFVGIGHNAGKCLQIVDRQTFSESIGNTLPAAGSGSSFAVACRRQIGSFPSHRIV